MKLFEPIALGPVALPNRIAVTAMVTRLSGADGFVNDRVVERYRRFAEGGAGLIVVEATSVHGGKSGPLLRASADEFVPGLARLAESCHAVSPAKVFLQIIHFLKIARSGWRQKIADLSRAELGTLPALFARAAVRAQTAGFDGVELHMAHAYTLSSMLSRSNKRGDEYGKSLENRMRLPSMVLETVRERVGDEYPVGVRFDAEECIKNGYSLPDSTEFALRFAELGASYLSLSAGGKFEDAIHRPGAPLYPYTGYSGDRCMPGARYPDGCNLHMAEVIRRALRSRGFATPVVGSGKIPFALAERALEEERCDIVGMARPLLADPYLPAKLRGGRWSEIIRCIYCNVCKNLDENFKLVRCYLWPKDSIHAPRPGEVRYAELAWPSEDPLEAHASRGRIELGWPALGALGYDVFRSVNGCEFDRLLATTRCHAIDAMAVSGRDHAYYVQAYDRSGRRGLPSNIVVARLPDWRDARADRSDND
ncbi:MAG: NADH:flavin oxidoreductase [Planctomycetota bacterium]